MSDKNQSGKVMVSFLHEINKATHFLMILLEGAEVKRERNNQFPGNTDIHMGLVVPLSYMDGHLAVYGVGSNKILQRSGEVEQLAYKGWIVDVYRIWEDCSRKKMKDSFNIPDAILPVLPVMGDLRKIRNDFVHGDGTAKNGNKNECEILKWFDPDESIRINMCHVLDFLNHIGIICGSAFTSEKEISVWLPGLKEQLLSRHPIPKIISVRTEISKDEETERTWCLISIVYDNGFYFHSPVPFDKKSLSLKESYDLFHKVEITPQGDLLWPNGYHAKAQDLYIHAVEYVDNPLTSQNADVPKFGFSGPWVQFRALK